MPSTFASAVLVAAVLLPAPAAAQQTVSHSASLPAQSMPWNGTLQLPRFDRGLGALSSASVFVRSTHFGSVGIENVDAAAAQPTIGSNATVTWTLPAVFVQPQQHLQSPTVPALAAYDGTTDYGGTSGATLALNASTLLTPYAVGMLDYGTWSSAPGAGGDVSIQVSASGSTWSPQAPSVVVTSNAFVAVEISVIYTYSPGTTRLCTTQQMAWNACPCGNPGSGTHGCANSFGSAGGALDAVGSTSLASDTLQLVGTSMTNGSVLYFQGTDYSSAGTVFGDGRRCVTGSVVRIATRTNSGGASQYPTTGGDAPISVRGGVTSPGMRTYQTYYRDLGTFCTAATFNVTNGVLVHWTL